MNNSILAKLAVMISANNAEFAKVMNASRNDLKTFTSSITDLAGKVGVAFGVREVAAFGLEVSKLAGEAKGVEDAFVKLPQSTKLMHDLKEATGGTVSELDLMKRSVQASNFDISLEALPKLLQFAAVRAQQTGQSVDYLVDSIVTGIGRKSKLILDNLGISAVQLGEKLKGVGTETASVADVARAVGEIAAESLEKSGVLTETNSTKLQRLAASWINVKVAIGEAANSTGLLGAAVDTLNSALDTAASKDLSFMEKLAGFTAGADGVSLLEQLKQARERIRIIQEEKKARKEQKQVIEEVDRAFKEFNGDIDAYGKAIQQHVLKTQLLAEFTKRLDDAEKERVITIAELREKQKQLNEMFEATDITDKKRQEAIGQNIAAINKQIEALDNLKKKQEELPKFTRPTIGTPREGENPFPDFTEEGKSPLDMLSDDMTKRLTEEKNAVDDVTLSYGELQAQIEQVGKNQKLAEEQMQRTTQVAQNFGYIVGEAFGQAAIGQKDFGDAMKQVVPQLLGLFLSQALGAQIAAGATEGAKTGNGFVGIALAAAGVAAISSLFKSATGYTGGSGGSAGLSNGLTVAGRFQPGTTRKDRMDINLEFRNGSLTAALKAEQSRNNRTGSGG